LPTLTERRLETERRAGFTLVETLAMLVVAAVIIVSTGQLLHQQIFFFDRGTKVIDRSEQLALAADSLTHDFGAARFVLPKSADRVLFTATPASDDHPARIAFITSGGSASGAEGEEAVSLVIEQGDGFAQLVRRRAAWAGPQVGIEDVRFQDPVILLKGNFSITFSFSELTDAGQLQWYSAWNGSKGLPHSIRLNLRDPVTQSDLLAAAEFPVYANASPACVTGEIDCLSFAAADPNQAGATSAQGGDSR